jgi:hypothetical protein
MGLVGCSSLQSCLAKRHAGTKGEMRYNSYSFLTSALDGVVSVTPRPRFTRRGRTPVPLDRRLGGPQSWSGHRG